jgi:peptide/nickel transport system substrate-binding protein
VLYGEGGSAAHAVLQAIYDGPIDLLEYRARPVILEDIPTWENGGVTLQPVTLAENEVFFNPVTLQPENLHAGDRYLPSGCNAADCLATYSGGEVLMDQMRVEFRLREGILWSDGQPLNAADSQFSYRLDRSGDLPTTKFLVDRTSDYAVIDNRTTRWVGIPGFIDSDYMTNFWTPLPEHVLGSIPVGELLQEESANRSPLGWGAYQVTAWDTTGITLVPNEFYAARENETPAFDRLMFRFLDRGGDSALQQIVTDECDIVDETLLDLADLPIAQDLQDEGKLKIWMTADAQIVRLDFNLEPVNTSRPALFQDTAVRKALAQCIDRSAIKAAMGGVSDDLPRSYMNVEQLTASSELELVSYDPAAGMQALEQMGWVLDEDQPDSPRVAFGVPGVRMGTPFSVSLLTADLDQMVQIAALVEADLESCSLGVEVNTFPMEELARPWPDGPVFGRGFDMVIWAWPEWISPLCEMFAGWEVPSSTQPFGINASGYRSNAYDTACQTLFVSLPGLPGYQESQVETMQLFNQDLPALPLYQPVRWVVSDPETCGLALDPVATNTLWNLEVLDSGESCP